MSLAEARNKLKQLGEQIRKQGEAFQQRKKDHEKDNSVALWPDNSKADWEKVNAEYDNLKRSIEASESAEALEARMNQISKDEKRSSRHGRQMPGLDDAIPGSHETYGEAGFGRDEARQFAQREADKRQALAAFFLRGYGSHKITSEMREACGRLKFDPSEEDLTFRSLDTNSIKDLHKQARRTNNIREIDIRALSKGGSNTGSELIPQTFAATFELAMLATSPMLAYVDTITTSTGENFLWPVGNDSFVEGAIAAEAADLSAVTQTDPHLTRLTLGAYDYHSRFLKVSEQLLRDSIVNVDQIVATMLGERLARILVRHFTVGTGSSQPFGIVTDAVNGRTTAGASAISYTDLVQLQHSVNPAYRGGATFMAHDSVIATLRLLVDSQNRPLWQSGLQDGIPDRLLGQPIIYNQYMASSVATTNITMLYGDMSYYKVRRVGGMSMRRLIERFAETREVGFIGYMSADGRLQKPGGSNAADVCPVKRMTQT